MFRKRNEEKIRRKLSFVSRFALNGEGQEGYGRVKGLGMVFPFLGTRTLISAFVGRRSSV